MGGAIGNYASSNYSATPPVTARIDFYDDAQERFRNFLKTTSSESPFRTANMERPSPSVGNNKANHIAWRQAMQLREIDYIRRFYQSINEFNIKGSQIGDCDPQNCIGAGFIDWQKSDEMMRMAPTGVPNITFRQSFLDWVLGRPGIPNFDGMNYNQLNLQSRVVENRLNGVPYYLGHNATSIDGVEWLPRLRTSTLTNRVKLEEMNDFIKTWELNNPNPTPFLTGDRPLETIPG
jgi:hypothetical protein